MQNLLPVGAKFVARKNKKRCPWFSKNTGNVFQKDGQCFLKLRATKISPLLNQHGGIGTDALLPTGEA